MKIARVELYGSPMYMEWRDYHEEDSDYVRLTEVAEVEFTDLPKETVVPKQVALLDAKIEDARAKFHEAISILEERKSKLLAITCDG